MWRAAYQFVSEVNYIYHIKFVFIMEPWPMRTAKGRTIRGGKGGGGGGGFGVEIVRLSIRAQ